MHMHRAAQWGLVPVDNGSYQVVQRFSRLCLDVDASVLRGVVPITQQVCDHLPTCSVSSGRCVAGWDQLWATPSCPSAPCTPLPWAPPP